MADGYKIIIHGTLPGFAPAEVAKALAPSLKQQEEYLLKTLTIQQQIILNLRNAKPESALALKQKIDAAGANCTLEALAPPVNTPIPELLPQFWLQTDLIAEGARRVQVEFGENTYMATRRHYNTRFTNVSERPIRVLKFGCFFEQDGAWLHVYYPGDWQPPEAFIERYGAPQDGWILPGQSTEHKAGGSDEDRNLWAYWCVNDLQEYFLVTAEVPASLTGGQVFGMKDRPASLPTDPYSPCPPEIFNLLSALQDYCRSLALSHSKVTLDFDAEGLKWIESTIDLVRRAGDRNQLRTLIPTFGAFFGECLIRKTGGRWIRFDEVLGVQNEEGMAFPFNKVMKQFANGREGGDSVLGMYNVYGLLMPAPLNPQQEKFRAVFHAIPQYRYCVSREAGYRAEWVAVRNISGIMVEVTIPELQHGQVSWRLDQIKGFRILDKAGTEISLDHIRLPEPPAQRATPNSPAASAPGEMLTEARLASTMHALRANFARSRTLFNRYSFESIKAACPPWLKPSDPLHAILDQQLLLCQEGQIVWGGLVQANSLLFRPGESDCPANLVYSPEPYFDARPQELRQIGRKLFQLKNTQPRDAEERRIAAIITDELDRSMMGWKLPASITGHNVLTSTFLVFRKHIPNGVLAGGCFPILMHPQTSAVMIVPFEFWPIDLIRLWQAQEL